MHNLRILQQESLEPVYREGACNNASGLVNTTESRLSHLHDNPHVKNDKSEKRPVTTWTKESIKYARGHNVHRIAREAGKVRG